MTYRCVCGAEFEIRELFQVHVQAVHFSSRYDAWQIKEGEP